MATTHPCYWVVLPTTFLSSQSTGLKPLIGVDQANLAGKTISADLADNRRPITEIYVTHSGTTAARQAADKIGTHLKKLPRNAFGSLAESWLTSAKLSVSKLLSNPITSRILPFWQEWVDQRIEAIPKMKVTMDKLSGDENIAIADGGSYSYINRAAYPWFRDAASTGKRIGVVIVGIPQGLNYSLVQAPQSEKKPFIAPGDVLCDEIRIENATVRLHPQDRSLTNLSR